MNMRFDYELFARDMQEYVDTQGIGWLANMARLDAQTIQDFLDGREPSIDTFLALVNGLDLDDWQDYFMWGE